MDDQRPDAPGAGEAPPPPPGTTPAYPPSGTASSGSTPPPPPTEAGGSGGGEGQTPTTAGDSWSAGDPAPSSRKKRSTGVVLAIIVGAIVIVAGAAVATTMFMLRGADEALATKVPASAQVFAAVYLDPSASQKVNLFRLTEKFPALGGEEQIEAELDSTLDDALEPMGLTSDDVTGWVGSQVGVTARMGADASDIQGAVLIATDDEAAARTALEKARGAEGSDTTWTQQEYGGADLWIGASEFGDDQVVAIVDGVVVFGSDRGFVEDVIDTANGDLEALEDTPSYTEAIDELPDGKLAAVYVDVGAFVRQGLEQATTTGELGAAQAGLGGLDPEAFGGMGMSISAQPNGIAMDVSVGYDPSKLPAELRDQLGADTGPNELLNDTPTDSYAVIAQTGIDRGLEQALVQAGPMLPELDELGLTGPDGVVENLTGDLVVTAGPSSSTSVPTGAVLLGTEDEAGMQIFLDTVAPMLIQGLGGVGAEDFSNENATLFRTPLQIRPAWQTETYEGVTISSLVEPSLNEMGVRPAYAVTNGSGVLATSVEEIKKVIDTANGESIETDTTFTEAVGAVGDANQSLLFLNVGGIVDAVQAADPSGTAIPPEVGANLEPIEAFVVGGRVDDDSQDARILLLIR
ncbi:MAG: DUF3352 domain-containing protein [Actinomycetota bacterium]